MGREEISFLRYVLKRMDEVTEAELQSVYDSLPPMESGARVLGVLSSDSQRLYVLVLAICRAMDERELRHRAEEFPGTSREDQEGICARFRNEMKALRRDLFSLDGLFKAQIQRETSVSSDASVAIFQGWQVCIDRPTPEKMLAEVRRAVDLMFGER